MSIVRSIQGCFYLVLLFFSALLSATSPFGDFTQPLPEDPTPSVSMQTLPPQDVLSHLHRSAYYYIIGKGEGVLELIDGSRWDINDRQANLVRHYWGGDDLILIKPCIACFSSYRYVLHNVSKDQAVEANLIICPMPYAAYTYTIINIDYTDGFVQLSDGTIWALDPTDTKLYYWEVGHQVLVGVNNYWRTAQMPHILINATLYHEPFIRAKVAGWGSSNPGYPAPAAPAGW